MRPHVPLIVLALALPCGAQERAADSREESIAAIDRLMAAAFEAYKKGDPAAVGALAVDDFDFVTSNAIWWRGREEVEKGLAVGLRSFRQLSAEMWPRIEKVRFMTPVLAVLQRGGGTNASRMTHVVTRNGGQWRFVASHGTRSAETPEFEPPGVRSLASDQTTLVSTWSADSEPSKSREEDETAIRGLVATAVEEFNNKDATDYAAVFVDDADFVTANAYWWRGREEIEKGIQLVLSGPLPATQVAEGVEKIRFLTPDVALVHAWVEADGYTLPAAYPSLPIVLGGRTTRVVAKQGAQWRVVAYPGSNAAVPPPPLRKLLPGILRPDDGD